MTQLAFDQLPLLLRYAQVVSVLEGVNRRSLLESIGDGSLRHWPAAPEPRHRRYYLKVDVAAMAGLQMRAPALPRLTDWMARGDLLRLLGVGQHFFDAVTRGGLLRCQREQRPPFRLRLLAPPEFAALQTGSTAVDGGKRLAQ